MSLPATVSEIFGGQDNHIYFSSIDVVRHYIQYICSYFYKQLFVIDCTRRDVVKKRNKVSGV